MPPSKAKKQAMKPDERPPFATRNAPKISGRKSDTFHRIPRGSAKDAAAPHMAQTEKWKAMPGSSGQVHLLRENDYALLSPNVVHRVVCEPHIPKNYFICIFRPSQSDNKPRLKSEDDFFQFLRVLFSDCEAVFGSDRKNCREMIEQLEKLMGQRELSWELEYRGLLLIFLLRLLRNFPLPVRLSTPMLSGDSVLAAEIDHYIRNHFNEPSLSLQVLADRFYTTPRNVNRILQKFYGTSYQNLLDANRLGVAKKYLLETDSSMEEIAELVGLSTVQSLFRLFRMHEGMKPNEYRVLHGSRR